MRRTILAVPMLRRHNRRCHRDPTGPSQALTDKQIDLVTTFADQAVIASRTFACSTKSRTRAESSRRRARTSASSSPT